MVIQDYIAIGTCLVLFYGAYRMRWLTMSGTIAALLMALVFIGAGLVTFSLPLLLLVGGTLLTKLNREPGEKHGRNARQVLANGLIGTLLLLCWTFEPGAGFEHPFFMAYLISFSVSTSDTFSSEIGKYFKGKTVDILNFKPMRPGLSGGVSLLGTLGGLLGSSLSGMLAFMCFDLSMHALILVCVFGFFGMIVDSVMGSRIQAKFKDAEGRIVETRSVGGRLYKGLEWCGNDAVNVLSNLGVVWTFLIDN